MRSFWREFVSSLRRTSACPIIGTVLTVFAFCFVAKDTVSLRIILPVSVLFLTIVFAFVDLSVRSFEFAKKSLPEVIQGRVPPGHFRGAIALLLLEKSNLYSHETLVSIYYRKDSFEELIGFGHVLTVQENGLIQVLVLSNFVDGEPDIWNHVQANDANYIKSLIVRPNIPRRIGDLIYGPAGS